MNIWRFTCSHSGRERENLGHAVTPEEFESDVFISYNGKDYEFVQDTLLEVLEKYNVQYRIHTRDFELGKPILENMAENVSICRKVLVLLSKSYLSSQFCLAELDMALNRSKTKRDASVIAIRLERFAKNKMPKALRYKTFLDLTDSHERTNWEVRLIEHLLDGGPVTRV